jgi:CheY-like chemotaxis protein
MLPATAANASEDIVPSMLIVDAQVDTRLLYRTVFEHHAVTLVEAEDGAEALGKAMSTRPDVILADTHLRRVDGYALCSLLRNDPLTRSTAIVIVTGAAVMLLAAAFQIATHVAPRVSPRFARISL